jgi:uncharacterized membrane protein YhhN
MKKRNLLFIILFVIISLVELAGRLLDAMTLEYAVKPLLMIWIAAYFAMNSTYRPWHLMAYSAFFFSWIGDILLMFSGGYDNETYFYAGVGGFFFAQIFYIALFVTSKENQIKGLLLRNPFWAVPLLAYGILICYLLYPNLEGIMVPVIFIYAATLIGMSLAAMNRRDRVNKRSYHLVLIGSFLFVMSDSMIAIDKFYAEIPNAGFLIMLTYILAQYLIMQGLLAVKDKSVIP